MKLSAWREAGVKSKFCFSAMYNVFTYFIVDRNRAEQNARMEYKFLNVSVYSQEEILIIHDRK